MKPLVTLGPAEARRLEGVLFDLDDTVLDHGALTRPAFDALEALSRAGLLLVGVTGRPASWGQVLVRQWPIAGMVTENGNVAVTRSGGKVVTVDRLQPEARRAQQARLRALADQILARFPELSESDGGLGRLTDVAFDVAEHAEVDDAVVQAAIEYARESGARTLLSSIHLHVTFDVDDKATGTLRFLQQTFGRDPTHSRAAFAFIGDSENDAAAFAAFETTIGVSNFRGRMTRPPRYQTSEPRGAGFAQAAERLLGLRG